MLSRAAKPRVCGASCGQAEVARGALIAMGDWPHHIDRAQEDDRTAAGAADGSSPAGRRPGRTVSVQALNGGAAPRERGGDCVEVLIDREPDEHDDVASQQRSGRAVRRHRRGDRPPLRWLGQHLRQVVRRTAALGVRAPSCSP